MYLQELVKRQCYGASCYDGYYDDDSDWGDWGRWVLFAGIIVAVILIFVVFACISARQRRRMGNRPFFGTGWAAHGPVNYYGPNGRNNNNNQSHYAPDQDQPWNQPVPPYPGPEGYYGQQNGVEMQPPAAAYHPQTGGEPVYTPPPGPPPGKN